MVQLEREVTQTDLSNRKRVCCCVADHVSFGRSEEVTCCVVQQGEASDGDNDLVKHQSYAVALFEPCAATQRARAGRRAQGHAE
jgi:hypothetical protein